MNPLHLVPFLECNLILIDALFMLDVPLSNRNVLYFLYAFHLEPATCANAFTA